MISTETYSQLYEILSYTDKALVMKIPVEILENIRNKRDINYVSKIDLTDVLNKDNITEQTYNILAYIKFQYWMTKEDQEKIKKLMEEKKKEKYSYEDLFNSDDKNKKESLELNEESSQKLVSKKEPWYKKILKIIRKLITKME